MCWVCLDKGDAHEYRDSRSLQMDSETQNGRKYCKENIWYQERLKHIEGPIKLEQLLSSGLCACVPPR
jgi:hypothetical protein